MLSQRARACFENNKLFEEEVGAALLPIGVDIMKGAVGVMANPDATALDKEYAQRAQGVANQILAEQSIAIGSTVASHSPMATMAVGSRSQAIQSLIRQLLRMPTWMMTADQWVADEGAAAKHISDNLALLLKGMLAQPQAVTPQN